MNYVQNAKPDFEKVLTHFGERLSTIRTGRAHAGLIEAIRVEVYGTMQPIKSMAAISVPDSKTLQIEPWDASVVSAIESALNKSDIGINPNVDGKVIRLIMPMMTEENRTQLAKQVKERMEEAKIALRQVREDVKKDIEKDEEFSEDGKRGALDDLDVLVKEMNMKAEQIGKEKEEQIMTI